MSAEQHERFAEIAKRLIKKNGRPMELVVVSSSGPDYNPTQTKSYVSVIGFMSNYKIDEIKGPIQNGDKKVLIAASTVDVINAEMKLLDKGIEYEIKMVDIIEPGEVDILYKIQARV